MKQKGERPAFRQNDVFASIEAKLCLGGNSKGSKGPPMAWVLYRVRHFCGQILLSVCVLAVERLKPQGSNDSDE